MVFDKAISMGHGQCPVKRYNHQLRDLIIRGRAQPSLIVSHELPLGRRGRARTSLEGDLGHQIAQAEREPGIRRQL